MEHQDTDLAAGYGGNGGYCVGIEEEGEEDEIELSIPTDQVLCGDALTILPTLPKASVDFVLTDPPFGLGREIAGDDSLAVFKNSLAPIYNILKDDRWFITFYPIGSLPEIVEAITEYFDYSWHGGIHYINKQRLSRCPVGKNLYSAYLVLKKGSPKRNYSIHDIHVFKYGRPSQSYHPVGKPLSASLYLVKFGSAEGDIVLDPFCGSGTFLVAAKQLSRKFLGIDIEEKYCEVSRERLTNVPVSVEDYFI